MKVKLLNDGGFRFLSDVDFPVEVSANDHPSLDYAIHVSSEELKRIGASSSCGILKAWSFCGDEFEVIHES